MRVRRAVTVTGAVAALVLLGAPAWADQTPSPSSTSDSVDPAGNPDCFLVPDATDQPVAQPTDEPTDAVTDQPTADPTDQATLDPTDAPTADPTDAPTADPTDAPTADPTDAPTPDATPGSHEVCLAYTDAVPGTTGGPTLGSGTPQLPFSGAPVGRYAATGLALVLAGAASVLLAGRKRA